MDTTNVSNPLTDNVTEIEVVANRTNATTASDTVENTFKNSTFRFWFSRFIIQFRSFFSEIIDSIREIVITILFLNFFSILNVASVQLLGKT